jgi:type IV fimbrial biogenesis protein FimT
MSSLTTVRYPPASALQRGFTLVEALVVLAIVAMLSAMAAPNFLSMVQRFRVDAASDALAATIQAARIEAIRTGQRVNITPQNCIPAGWGCGWVMYADLDTDDVQDANEPTIRRVDVMANVTITKSAPINLVSISRFGQATALGNTTFLIGPQGVQSSDCKSLVLNIALRQSSTTGTGVCPP